MVKKTKKPAKSRQPARDSAKRKPKSTKSPVSPRKLSPRQKLFPKEYLIDLNATQAAKRCGYSEKTAYSQGQRLLKHVEVQQIIKEELEKKIAKTDNAGQMVIDELTRIIQTNMFDFFTIGDDGLPYADLSKVPYEMGRVISKIHTDQYIDQTETVKDEDGEERKVTVKKVRIEFWSKTAATEQLGKYYELFTMKHKHDHSGQIDHKHKLIEPEQMSDEEAVDALRDSLSAYPRG